VHDATLGGCVNEQTVQARVDRLEPTRQHVGRRRGRDGSSTQRPRQQAFELGGHDCGVRRPGGVSFETCPLEHEQGRDEGGHLVGVEYEGRDRDARVQAVAAAGTGRDRTL